MGLTVSIASAVVITAPVEIGVSVGALCFMNLLYVPPLRMPIDKGLQFVPGIRIMGRAEKEASAGDSRVLCTNGQEGRGPRRKNTG
jgi:hypothetical protein